MRSLPPTTRLASLVLTVLAVALLAAPPARAADDGGTPDDIPDASVGTGGSDQTGQEGDDSADRVSRFCRNSHDCNKGFGCKDARCVYIGYRDATGGCLLGLDAWSTVILGGVLLSVRRRWRG